MKNNLLLTSRQWISYYQANAASIRLAPEKPSANPALPRKIRAALEKSLPAWQLGETGEGSHLRAAARKFATAHHDPDFPVAVDLFIREEQRHGAALGNWLNEVGIPRKTKDLGNNLFRFCRYALSNYSVWATVVVMVELMAEIYYAAVRRVTPCPLLKFECRRILSDEVRHIRFQCEHLAVARQKIPRLFRPLCRLAESAFFLVVCAAVWTGHKSLLRLDGFNFRRFTTLAFLKLSYARKLMEIERYAEIHEPTLARAA